MQRNPRYREGSSLARLPPPLPPRIILPPLFCSFRRRAFASNTLITRRALACPSRSLLLTPSLFPIRVISYPLRYYERACNGNRRMIHGDVKRDGSRCRLETQSLPIRERPMPREESGVSSLPLDKNIKTAIY